MTTRGIRTSYAGIEFRSRLEARWAFLFGWLGWRWTYEPVDAAGYIPDFLIHGERPFFVEVGPVATLEEYKGKAGKPDQSSGELGRDVLVVGVDPVASIGGDAVAGWFGEAWFGRDQEDQPLWWERGNWATCRCCNRTGIYHSEASFALRPCGHYDGDHYLGQPDLDLLYRGWAGATNETQWRR